MLKPTQEPNDEGGFDFGFGNPLGDAFDGISFDRLAALKTVWMGFKPVGYKGSGSKYIRGKQVSESVTHELIVRHLAVADLGSEFVSAFGDGFDTMADLGPLKSEYYLFVQSGSSVKGRLFRIDSMVNVKEEDEFLSIAAEEIEERGTGSPA